KINKDGSEETIFDREVIEGISNVISDKIYDTEEEEKRIDIYMEDFRENISDSFKKKTMLCDIAQRVNNKQGMFKEIISVYEWFSSIIILFPHTKYIDLNKVVTDENKKSFFTELISYLDTGIHSIEGKKEILDIEKLANDISYNDREKLMTDITNSISELPINLNIKGQIYPLAKDESGNIVYDKLKLNHGNREDLFDYFDESDGTKRLFDLLPLFFKDNSKSVIFIDEIDRSLHTILTRRFMELFYLFAKENSCQLIATTHDINLLDLDLLRQDEIWFVDREKNNSSKIYSLNKFKERFDKKINKEYMLGRYGAIPIFNGNIIDGGNANE
ncbi:MAG: ATP-binding protein, partial [Lachnoclostridium sp.]|nr:ATP-binding protein [Lachnoclostridium sp.]